MWNIGKEVQTLEKAGKHGEPWNTWKYQETHAKIMRWLKSTSQGPRIQLRCPQALDLQPYCSHIGPMGYSKLMFLGGPTFKINFCKTKNIVIQWLSGC